MRSTTSGKCPRSGRVVGSICSVFLVTLTLIQFDLNLSAVDWGAVRRRYLFAEDSVPPFVLTPNHYLSADAAKQLISDQDRLSYITEHSFDRIRPEAYFYYLLQTVLAPTILNPEPGELIAIVELTDENSSRLTGLGYEWIYRATPLQGIARRISP